MAQVTACSEACTDTKTGDHNAPTRARGRPYGFFALLWVAVLATLAGAAEEETSNPSVEIATSVGTMTVELWPEKAPLTVANFLERVDEGFYDGLIFHRVIAGFVIQAGGFDAKMNYREAPATVVNESSNGVSNLQWTIAMARASDPDSAGAQFYINVSDNTNLDAAPGRPGYTVFGKLTAGEDVAGEIEFVATGVTAGMPDVPREPVTILSTRRVSGALSVAPVAD
ncbi:MAG: peptidylprolyl isomerase A [Gammaproteobacteria bacterium]|nr:peptidylprolyl isomerase A [Gammaproteobacteria bacterium]